MDITLVTENEPKKLFISKLDAIPISSYNWIPDETFLVQFHENSSDSLWQLVWNFVEDA